MYCLGRYELLEGPFLLHDLVGVIDNNVMPTFMPEVGKDNYIVCAVQYTDKVIELTVCKSLEQMQNQYAWIKKGISGRGDIFAMGWYFADSEQCDTAHEKLVAASA
jgi:hypothetical protein